MKNAVVLLFVASLIPGLSAVAADEEQKAEQTLLERVDEKILGIRNNLVSAESKWRNKVIDSGSTLGDEPPTPIWECCRGNVVRIRKRSEELSGAIRILAACYEAEQNYDGTSALGVFRQDHADLDRGVERMVDATERPQAEAALKTMTPVFKRFQRSRDRLPACPAEAPEAPDADDEKKGDTPAGQ